MKRNLLVLVLVLTIGGLLMAYPLNNDYAQPVREEVQDIQSGWIEDANTWTYSSADSPTFIASVNADMTGILSAGMRVRLTQTTVKYFIVTAVDSYSGGATLVTMYGGTDYTLANAAVSSPGYSHMKAPFGFPLDPDKWAVEATNSSDLSQASASAGTWYNIGSISINIPIGVWFAYYKVFIGNSGGTNINLEATLSTGSNTESNSQITSGLAYPGTSNLVGTLTGVDVVSAASKTTYYLNEKTDNASSDILVYGGSFPTIIRAVCAYL